MSIASYDEAVERVTAAKARGALATSTAPHWVITARTALGPLKEAIVAVREGRLDSVQFWLDHTWRAIMWAHEDYGSELWPT